MDYRLDSYLDRQDELAVEDGEALEWAWCWACGYYVPAIAMPPLPDMMCAWCENDLRFVDELTKDCREIHERRQRIREMDLTPEDVWGG